MEYNEKDFPYYNEFEKQGEDYVRQTFTSFPDRNDSVARSARSWLEMKRVEREVAAASKRDAREEETLAIAKEANSIARSQATSASRAARYAMYAAIIAAIAAISANKDQIFEFIDFLMK